MKADLGDLNAFVAAHEPAPIGALSVRAPEPFVVASE